ncbi:MAG TPA: calcium/sodium antiporter [Chiayiivirga sp.]|nr:calcium/sodium antiporter [Chiayiivirga sp.]
MLLSLLLFTLGLVVLAVGAEVFLRGAVSVGLRFGISPFVIGLTIVGFGTSAPELAVNLSAALRGSTDMAMGNVVGSNIANVGLIIGLSALLTPLAVHMRLLRVETPVMILFSLLLWGLCADGMLSRFDAGILLAGFIGMMLFIMRTAKGEPDEVQAELASAVRAGRHPASALVFLGLGLAGLVGGAEMMVRSAISLAQLWGMSDLLIGLTIVAIGTSLPELASSVVAALRGQNDIAVGNVVGSNLFNILLILGVTGLVKPLPTAPSLLTAQIPVMIVFAVVLWAMMWRRKRVSRRTGALMLTGYVGFIVWQVVAAV